MAQLCAHDAGVNVFYLNGPEIISQYHGESEQALHEVFKMASQAEPAVVRFLEFLIPCHGCLHSPSSYRMRNVFVVNLSFTVNMRFVR